MCKNFFLATLITLALLACSKSDPKTTVGGAGNKIIPAVLSDKFQPQYDPLPRGKGGACVFGQPVVEGEFKLLTGWAAISASEGVIAEEVVLGVTFNGQERFTLVTKQKREDVVKYFNSAGLLESGFAVHLNLKDAPAGAVLAIYQVFQGKIYKCDVQKTI